MKVLKVIFNETSVQGFIYSLRNAEGLSITRFIYYLDFNVRITQIKIYVCVSLSGMSGIRLNMITTTVMVKILCNVLNLLFIREINIFEYSKLHSSAEMFIEIVYNNI